MFVRHCSHFFLNEKEYLLYSKGKKTKRITISLYWLAVWPWMKGHFWFSFLLVSIPLHHFSSDLASLFVRCTLSWRLWNNLVSYELLAETKCCFLVAVSSDSWALESWFRYVWRHLKAASDCRRSQETVQLRWGDLMPFSLCVFFFLSPPHLFSLLHAGVAVFWGIMGSGC